MDTEHVDVDTEHVDVNKEQDEMNTTCAGSGPRSVCSMLKRRTQMMSRQPHPRPVMHTDSGEPCAAASREGGGPANINIWCGMVQQGAREAAPPAHAPRLRRSG